MTNVQTAPRIERSDRGNSHSYKIDGQKAQGVTTIISAGVPKPALTYWAARVAAEYAFDNRTSLDGLDRAGFIRTVKGAPWAERDSKAVRGTEVHDLAEQLSLEQTVDVPDHVAGFVEAYLKWVKGWAPTFVLSEVSVGSTSTPYPYAGTLDAIVDLPDGRRVLVDYKTSSAVYRETCLQLAAYRFADWYVDPHSSASLPMLEVDCCAVLRLDGSGEYDFVEVAAERSQLLTFLAAAEVASFAKMDDEALMRKMSAL